MRAKDVMTTPVVTATPGTKLKEIAETLIRNDVSAVPIVDEAGDLVGIVTEADVVRLQAVDDPRRHAIPARSLDGRVPKTAADVMTKRVVTVSEDDDVTAVARLMLSKHLKRIPVVAGTKIAGIISRRDILNVLARSDQSIETELQQRLDDEVLLLGWFHAHVSDGVVTLVGPRDKNGRRLARLIARSIPGVVAVQLDDEA